MITNLNESLVAIAVGMRFRANFSIEDQIGKIVDTILYADKSFFNPILFPKVRSLIGRKMLFNEESDHNLTIDNSNIILEIPFGTKFTPNDTRQILDHFRDDIITGIMNKFSIREIVRIGYIKRYIFGIKDLANRFVNKTIGQSLGGINDINLSFSKKMPLSEALIKRDVNDYDNAIFNVIKKADRDEIFMSVDYQRYYQPSLDSSTQIKFDEFIQQAETFNTKGYLPWLNTNYIEE
jgi:hypothetical protein